MMKFKSKNGGIAEVFTQKNIERLRNNPNYTELNEKAKPKKEKITKVEEPSVEEVVEDKPLQ